MKKIIYTSMAVFTVIILAGCAGAAFNKIDLTLNRNITVGQELLDLQAAHEKGVISDTEYAAAKKDLLKMVSALGELKDD